MGMVKVSHCIYLPEVIKNKKSLGLFSSCHVPTQQLVLQKAKKQGQFPEFGDMDILVLMLLCLFASIPTSLVAQLQREAEELISSQPKKFEGRVIEVKGGPESVTWVVQLSDLHFSVHHPDRALDFKKIVGPALNMINPSLVLVTGDLTGLIIGCFILFFLLFFLYNGFGLNGCLCISSFSLSVASWEFILVKI